MKIDIRYALTALVLTLSLPGATAAPLNLTPDFPDIGLTMVDTNFTFTDPNGKLEILGFASSLTLTSGGPSASIDGDFKLLADIDKFGNLVAGGTNTIEIIEYGIFPTVVDTLTATVTAFGFSLTGGTIGNTLEFLATIDGDPSIFGPNFGTTLGVIIDIGDATGLRTFANSWGADGKTGDAFAQTNVPAPPALLLLFAALGALAARTARRRG